MTKGSLKSSADCNARKQKFVPFFGATDKTLERWCRRTYRAGFSEVFRQKRGIGKISLRRSQFRLAEKNANMAIWLGKQYLNQRDEPLDDAEEQKEDPLSQSLRELGKELESE